MKTQRLNQARVIIIAEALNDYLEHYLEEYGVWDDVLYHVNDRFEEFVLWAYDDIIISSEERDILLNGNEWELIEGIKTLAIKSYSVVIH